MLNAKEIKKLADTCRKAGIKQFKCSDFEFTLTDETPVSSYKKRQAKIPPKDIASLQGEIESDSPTEDELLLWSVNEESPEEKAV